MPCMPARVPARIRVIAAGAHHGDILGCPTYTWQSAPRILPLLGVEPTAGPLTPTHWHVARASRARATCVGVKEASDIHLWGAREARAGTAPRFSDCRHVTATPGCGIGWDCGSSVGWWGPFRPSQPPPHHHRRASPPPPYLLRTTLRPQPGLPDMECCALHIMPPHHCPPPPDKFPPLLFLPRACHRGRGATISGTRGGTRGGRGGPPRPPSEAGGQVP